ncbi:MFS transporter [Saccharopolyspora spinosporotrichia]
MTVTGLLVVGQLYAVIPLLPAMARDWGGTHAEMTATSSLFGIAYAVGFLLTGPLSDRFGRRRVVVTGLTAMAVTTLAIAFAPCSPRAERCEWCRGFAPPGSRPPRWPT